MNQIDKHEHWLEDLQREIDFLSNLHTLSNASMETPKEDIILVREKEWNPRQWDAVKQLKSMFLQLQTKLYEHTDKDKENTIYIYKSIKEEDDKPAIPKAKQP